MIEAIILTIEFAAIYTLHDAIKEIQGAAKRKRLMKKLRGAL